MGLIREFKEFAIRGNVIDLAVGVVIGAAFGKIVTGTVDDIIMPLIGMVTGGQTFTDKFFVLKYAKDGDVYNSLAQAKAAGANVFAYGHFIQTIVDFLIIAFFIFLAVKGINQLKKKEEAAPAAPSAPSPTDVLLTEIRDELRKNK